MSSAPEDLPPDEPQTPEERKKALDAIGYKRGTSLPSEVSGGPAPSAGPVKNDQFVPPTLQPGPSAGAGAGSDVGWQSVPKDESKSKGGAFAAARRSQTLGPVELAAKKKDEEAKAPAIEKPKPYRGREEEVHIPKNRWGQVPDTATARSVWADQLGITKPASTMRGPSSSLRGRLKRVMSADIFNVRELYSLRGIAALIVFIAQAQIFAAHAKPGYPINMIGAQIFFVMSGFVITRWLMVNETGSLQRTLGEFYARRALRIFPMYYLVLCVLMFTGHLSNAESFFCGLFNFSAFQSIKVAPQLLQYWTLCVELQFYVLFPILLMITPQRFRMALVVLLTGATVACTYLSAQSTPHAQDWLLLPISGQYIMWGCLAGYMDVKSDIALSLNASMCVILGIFSQIGIHTWLLAYSNIPTGDISDLLWKGLSTINALSLSMLIFGLWRTSNAWLRGLCANDVLVYFGKISYGFYILLPLCFFMQPSIIAVMPILAKVPAVVTSFVITFIMAVVTFHYLQTPINNVREHLPIAR
jgi:peptidoglycan/LPS O-acetylase OafA/YrhL